MKFKWNLIAWLWILLLGCKKPNEKVGSNFIDSYPFSYVRQLSHQIGNSLPKENGETVVRIWVIESMVKPNRFYTFTKEDTTYYSQVCLFYESTKYSLKQINDTLESRHSQYSLDSLVCYKIKPKLPVKRLIDTTFSLGIDTMPSQPMEIKSKFGDGTTYVVEIKKGNSYKIIEYANPKFIKDPNHIRFSEYLDILLGKQ